MKAITRFPSLLAFVFLSFNCSSFAQKKDNYALKIDSLIKIADPKFNGEILIARNGKTLYNKVHGFANFETKKPLTTNNQFEIMSNSKLIAAVLILLEVEKGKINLQDPIKKYLPELTRTWADSVTVHQLLNHTHGIVDTNKPLEFKPGTNFHYGNMSYSLLGQIVAHTSNKSYSEVVNALFKKLKMKNTFAYDQDKIQNLATGYINNKNSFEAVKKTLITADNLGADGIISTVYDLAIWNNNLHKGKILKPESYQLIIKPSVLSQHNFFGKEKEGYGYSIRIIEKDTVKYLGHTGLGDGFSSVNLYFPESDVSLIVIENQMNEDSDLFYASERKIKDILIKSDLVHPKK
jgi:CubicO group peptidase (beta-lactamase class C family)